jgi:lysophospholipase L1-like esterase
VERIVVAALGDSISAGSPLWDPDPAVRARIPAPDERSQWEWWAARRDPRLDFRNHGVYGERTDQIAARLDAAATGAAVLVVQGGINDVVQRRPVEDAARNLAEMVERGRRLGLAVALTDVLPWPNGDSRAADAIVRLNALVRDLAADLDVALLPFHDTLADAVDPHRMADGLTDDGDHPSVEGHRLLGERAFRLPQPG